MNSKDAELYLTAHEIRILANIMTKIANRDIEQRLSAHGINISGLQHGVLRLLQQHAYTSSELSRKMMLTPATLVPAVDALERHGLVKRERDPHDRRRVPLALTPSGHDVLQRAPIITDDDALVNGLSEMGQHKRKALVELLRELLSKLIDPAAVRDIGLSVQQMLREG